MGKIELCVYSGYKIYPGHGRSLGRVDGKNLRFLSGRTHKAHLLKRNPREVTWTVLYRRKHKKGLEEDVAKKRNKRSQRSGRPRESRPSELPRSRRSSPQLRRLHLLLTRKQRRPMTRLSRMFRSLLQELEERDKL